MSPIQFLKSLVKRLPGISKIVAHRDELLAASSFVPAGHFLSPIVSIPEYLADQASGLGTQPTQMLGVDMNDQRQIEVLYTLAPFWRPDLFHTQPSPSHRYYCENPAFGAADAFVLHAMIRHLRPQRIIEVGSGFSSCVTLDVNEHYFDNAIKLAFIEPYPKVFKQLIKRDDLDRVELYATRLQEIPFDFFAQLQPNDVLFIDSTHVSKTGSDVNYLFFEILPRLAPGVIVHIHDIFYPFDYPKDWILEGRSWNEGYMLRAFLQYNDKIEILFFSDYFKTAHADLIAQLTPGLAMDGGSIWLQVKGA
jgi:predicted O-methyltransferase YrrM